MGARLGQHFLTDEGVRDGIVAAAGINPGERVLEIGPGRGMLTRALLHQGAELTAVEMDERLAEGLSKELKGEPRLRVIRADFLKLRLSELGPGPFKIAANLPYAVATPILQRLLPWPSWDTAVLMFQQEVAERIAAESGGRYGLLGLSVRLYAGAEVILDVPRDCFSPRPKVDSSVVRLMRRQAPLLAADRIEPFFRVARAAFGQRRKMAAGPIASALKMKREDVVKALERCGVAASARAEEMPPEVYLRLPAELGL